MKQLFTIMIVCLTIISCNDDEKECSAASAAEAGPDQIITGLTAILEANEPQMGEGTWTISSGIGGQFSNANSHNSSFTGVSGAYELVWSITGCPSSSDTVSITLVTVNEQGYGVSKTSAIPGEIITVFGPSFTSNFQGMAQIHWVKSGGFSNGSAGIFPDMSFTQNAATVMVYPTNGGETGEYTIFHGKRTEADLVQIPTGITITISSPGQNQFYTSSTLSTGSALKGSTVSVGVKNGGPDMSDYDVWLVDNNTETGIQQRYHASLVSFNRLAFANETMDNLTFTIPSAIPSSLYWVEITDKKSDVRMIGGWNQWLNIQ